MGAHGGSMSTLTELCLPRTFFAMSAFFFQFIPSELQIQHHFGPTSHDPSDQVPS